MSASGQELVSGSVNERLAEFTVIMPIGGLATRARSITEDKIPKHLIPLANGEPVISMICKGLQRVGFRNFTFCLGHHADQLKTFLATEAWKTDALTDYTFSIEDLPLGPDGAILKAVNETQVKQNALVIPGDLALPWQSVAKMALRHQQMGSDITIGVTSHVTNRTTDVGKMVVEAETDRLLWCFGRDEEPTHLPSNARYMTSGGCSVIAIQRYKELCGRFLGPTGAKEPFSMRDEILPWAMRSEEFQIDAFDLAGEVLDIGTPNNIRYAQGATDL